MMNENIIKEAVAAGLRAMSNTPAALLYIDGTDGETFDYPVVCGLSVYHTQSLYCATWSANYHQSSFIPIWHDESDSQIVDRARFAEAYNDAISIWGGNNA
jgi:hypothetical protein